MLKNTLLTGCFVLAAIVLLKSRTGIAQTISKISKPVGQLASEEELKIFNGAWIEQKKELPDFDEVDKILREHGVPILPLLDEEFEHSRIIHIKSIDTGILAGAITSWSPQKQQFVCRNYTAQVTKYKHGKSVEYVFFVPDETGKAFYWGKCVLSEENGGKMVRLFLPDLKFLLSQSQRFHLEFFGEDVNEANMEVVPLRLDSQEFSKFLNQAKNSIDSCFDKQHADEFKRLE